MNLKLKDFIKALIDALDELGDCDVLLTTKNETELYPAVLLSYHGEDKIVAGEPFLKVEGIEVEDYKEYEKKEDKE